MMKKFFKYTVSAAIIATMFQTTPAFAEPGAPVTQEQINETEKQIDSLETKIQQLDDKIVSAMVKSEELNKKINSQQERINKTKAEIEAAKKDLENHKQIYAERLKSIQAEGRVSVASYAELLLSSENISEFLTRFTAISAIIQSDTDLLNGLKEKQLALKEAEERLHTELVKFQKNKEELAAQQKQIEADKKEVENALAQAEAQLQQEKEQLAAQQEAERQAQLAAQQEAERQAQLAAQQAAQSTQQASAQQQTTSKKVAPSTPSGNVVSKPSGTAANKVISYAKQFLGVPYVWGGTTPSGFDCSGFTQYVFRNSVGINLPRVSRDQQNVGKRVPLNALQPGDLVFRGNPAHHVGIYIGGGQYIHAPRTGDVVKIASFNPSKFTNAVRVLQ
ncbi:NlpC/P60 family protein [Neobacillus sedimentimangrovi]|jgi:peptidoglycan DL-endopeptidase CwlO|uniref:NlpC/P60 family protein n=1 Tax=Neobacillus sedimentimangrovi TaxID=2699460 RepID=A0ABS8QLN2_9BACI|nr:C40 family peptidase [Neobacillus sedimentimangrovi]MCD4840221.1 NlpC/P60 family protein [Neobacillus sedimentimangrovi]